MDTFQVSVADFKGAGDRLFRNMWVLLGPGLRAAMQGRSIKKGDYSLIYDSRNHPLDESANPGLKAIVSVLRSCVRRELPAKSDLISLNQAIQDRPVNVEADKGSNGIMLGLWKGGVLWAAVYEMAYYTNRLTEDPRLREHESIGVCPWCNGVFLKKRTDQEYCTSRCRSEAWAAEKGKEYFAEKARESRAARKAMATRRHATEKTDVGKVKGNNPRKAENEGERIKRYKRS